MKILFLLGATSRIRNFDNSLMLLADRGHVIQLTGRLRKGSFELPPTVAHERITGRVNPIQRIDEWRDFVDLLRGARDYVRYFDPRYAQATRLVRRAYEIAPTQFVLFCERHPWIKRHWKLASRLLALCEDLIPVDPGFEAFIRDETPDLVLVTPLVTFESYQTDYVKAAHRLGLPVVFLPFSWDNLTNKGLMRVQPDRVIVWNDTQLREAVDLHGCPPENIVITGAARFDDFFARTPSASREEFFEQYGLDPSRPMIVYLCSSQLTGPNEMELVRRWAESLRASDDEVLRGCNILLRPHPALRKSWASVDLSGLGPIGMSLTASRDADQELHDSLHHSHAAIGLNTSAMLEAAIVGRPVHTLLIPGFDEGQIGTMHFHYLVEAYGGLATVARAFEEHHHQLAAVLRGAPIVSEKNRSFAAQFLRPAGVETPVYPALAAEIERAGSIVRQPQKSTPFWHYPLRAALRAWLRKNTVRARTHGDTSIVASSLSLRPVRTALEEIQQGTTPVFVGPWLDTPGNEILYWVPFVRWVSEAYGVPAERLIAISHTGVGAWYTSVAQRHLDSRTLFSPDELERWTQRTVPQGEQDFKQAVLAPLDQEVIDRAARAFELSEYQILHPFTFFRLFSRLNKDRQLAQLSDVLRPQRVESAKAEGEALPRSFVAVSVAFTPGLPNNEDNARFLTELLVEIAASHDVVIVDAPTDGGVEIPPTPRVRQLSVPAGMSDALPLQIRALSQATAFVGSYGDLAIIAASCGTPALAYHSDRLPPDHPDRVHAASGSGQWGPLTLERMRRFKGVRLPVAARA